MDTTVGGQIAGVWCCQTSAYFEFQKNIHESRGSNVPLLPFAIFDL